MDTVGTGLLSIVALHLHVHVHVHVSSIQSTCTMYMYLSSILELGYALYASIGWGQAVCPFYGSCPFLGVYMYMHIIGGSSVVLLHMYH